MDINNINLISSDNKVFQVNKDIATISNTVENLLEDTECNMIPIPNINSNTMEKVLEFAKIETQRDKNANKNESDRVEFEKGFLDSLDKIALFDVIVAANYLHINSLLDITCQRVTDMMKKMTPEQIREEFHIENDLTEEELEELKKENQWYELYNKC